MLNSVAWELLLNATARKIDLTFCFFFFLFGLDPDSDHLHVQNWQFTDLSMKKTLNWKKGENNIIAITSLGFEI